MKTFRLISPEEFREGVLDLLNEMSAEELIEIDSIWFAIRDGELGRRVLHHWLQAHESEN